MVPIIIGSNVFVINNFWLFCSNLLLCTFFIMSLCPLYPRIAKYDIRDINITVIIDSQSIWFIFLFYLKTPYKS